MRHLLFAVTDLYDTALQAVGYTIAGISLFTLVVIGILSLGMSTSRKEQYPRQ
jgi:hypothetical protein